MHCLEEEDVGMSGQDLRSLSESGWALMLICQSVWVLPGRCLGHPVYYSKWAILGHPQYAGDRRRARGEVGSEAKRSFQ